jgi:hypothetical protein
MVIDELVGRPRMISGTACAWAAAEIDSAAHQVAAQHSAAFIVISCQSPLPEISKVGARDSLGSLVPRARTRLGWYGSVA